MNAAYTIHITDEQRMLLQRAAARLADDLNSMRVPGLSASDPSTGVGDCIGTEVEALRDMLTDLELTTHSGDNINDFTA